MSHPDPADFHRKIAALLAHETPWGRRVALYGPDPQLAKSLGVTNEMLNRAAYLVREGFGTRDKPSPVVRIKLRHPLEIGKPLEYLARSMGCSRALLVRDMLHAVMQLPCEPTPQPAGTRRIVMFRGKRTCGKYLWDKIQVSNGLKAAASQRATAYGATLATYIRLWTIDLVEGKLGNVDIRPILITQMFDRPDAYVLPAPPKG